MIIHLKKEIGTTRAQEIATQIDAFLIEEKERYVLISSSGQKTIDDSYAADVLESFVFDNDIQLASRAYTAETREVKIGNVTIG